jgi:hypothetical protein
MEIIMTMQDGLVSCILNIWSKTESS